MTKIRDEDKVKMGGRGTLHCIALTVPTILSNKSWSLLLISIYQDAWVNYTTTRRV